MPRCVICSRYCNCQLALWRSSMALRQDIEDSTAVNGANSNTSVSQQDHPLKVYMFLYVYAKLLNFCVLYIAIRQLISSGLLKVWLWLCVGAQKLCD